VAAARDRIELASEYGCRHFQFRCEAISNYTAICAAIAETLGNDFETSIHLSSIPAAGHASEVGAGLQKIIAEFAAVSPAPMFFVLSSDFALNPARAPDLDRVRQLLRFVVPELERVKRFICVENGGFRSVLDHIQTIDALMVEIGSQWLYALLNVSQLGPSALRSNASFIRTKTLAVSYFEAREDNAHIMEAILKDLFYVPFRDRPFILADLALNTVQRCLNHFRKVTTENNLYYY
jgi:hypothetical protein